VLDRNYFPLGAPGRIQDSTPGGDRPGAGHIAGKIMAVESVVVSPGVAVQRSASPPGLLSRGTGGVVFLTRCAGRQVGVSGGLAARKWRGPVQCAGTRVE